jgi:hypothetical protein
MKSSEIRFLGIAVLRNTTGERYSLTVDEELG